MTRPLCHDASIGPGHIGQMRFRPANTRTILARIEEINLRCEHGFSQSLRKDSVFKDHGKHGAFVNRGASLQVDVHSVNAFSNYLLPETSPSKSRASYAYLSTPSKELSCVGCNTDVSVRDTHFCIVLLWGKKTGGNGPSGGEFHRTVLEPKLCCNMG